MIRFVYCIFFFEEFLRFVDGVVSFSDNNCGFVFGISNNSDSIISKSFFFKLTEFCSDNLLTLTDGMALAFLCDNSCVFVVSRIPVFHRNMLRN